LGHGAGKVWTEGTLKAMGPYTGRGRDYPAEWGGVAESRLLTNSAPVLSHNVTASAGPLSFTWNSSQAAVTAITYAVPPHCYCSVTPGEIREFGIKEWKCTPSPPPPPPLLPLFGGKIM
jgi:hypothetical protein